MTSLSPEPPRAPVCSKCAKGIECCAFCDEPECRVALCYQCLSVDLRQAMAQPHTHGG